MTHTVEVESNGLRMTLETGKVAKQADGAVVVRLGGSMVLATCVAAKSAKEAQDFFPLTVEYRERAYAGGRIPGGYFTREGAPVKKETLTSRLIDRPIRPLFPDGFRNEVQVICLTISGDQENDPDILAMNGLRRSACRAPCSTACRRRARRSGRGQAGSPIRPPRRRRHRASSWSSRPPRRRC
jgi:polyribonucleotide nucleotidyltransferase